MIPLTRPTLPKLSSLRKKMEDVFATGMITNAKYVAKLEQACARFLGVKRVVAVNTGTAALLLSLKAMELKGEVILPSFTFTAGGHVLRWSGLKPVFVDIDPQTFTIDPHQIEKKITARTVAIMPTHAFGNPCAIKKISALARKYHLKVIYDAAHAFGATYRGKSIAAFGDVSCFSLTPSKILVAGEGGLIATNNVALAEKMVLGRNNGDSFDRSEEFLGISARMNEFSAIIALGCLRALPANIKRRAQLVALYRKKLSKIPGISFQESVPGAHPIYRDMAIVIEPDRYGHTRDELLRYLRASEVECKVYFDPPLHKKVVYREYRNMVLPNTDLLHSRILDLPLYSHMPVKEVLQVCSLVSGFAKK